MGRIYTLPVVTDSTLTTNGLYAFDRAPGGKVYVGANIPNVKFAFDFRSADIRARVFSASENAYTFYWYWGSSQGIIDKFSAYGMRSGVYALSLGTGAGYANNPQLDYYQYVDDEGVAPLPIAALVQEFGHFTYPITYRLTNATSNGPSEAAVGDTVNVGLSFPEGYGIVNPSSDVYVTNNGVIVPSSYVNGTLTFTMPDPS